MLEEYSSRCLGFSQNRERTVVREAITFPSGGNLAQKQSDGINEGNSYGEISPARVCSPNLGSSCEGSNSSLEPRAGHTSGDSISGDLQMTVTLTPQKPVRPRTASPLLSHFALRVFQKEGRQAPGEVPQTTDEKPRNKVSGKRPGKMCKVPTAQKDGCNSKSRARKEKQTQKRKPSGKETRPSLFSLVLLRFSGRAMSSSSFSAESTDDFFLPQSEKHQRGGSSSESIFNQRLTPPAQSKKVKSRSAKNASDPTKPAVPRVESEQDTYVAFNKTHALPSPQKESKWNVCN